MTARGQPLERLVRKYFVPRSAAFNKLLERGIRAGEFRRADARHTAISIVGLIVFYFSAAPVLQLLGHADAYNAANLERRKQEVLDFIRHGLFLDPEAPLAMKRRLRASDRRRRRSLAGGALLRRRPAARGDLCSPASSPPTT